MESLRISRHHRQQGKGVFTGPEPVVIAGKIPGQLFTVEILFHKLKSDRKSQSFILKQKTGQIFPSSCCCKDFTVIGLFQHVKLILVGVQIGEYGTMDSGLQRIGTPGWIVCLYLNIFQPVQSGDIEFTDRFIIFRRVSGCCQNPAIRKTVAAEGFILQKLQHGRCQSFRDAVDLIQEQKAFPASGLFDPVKDGCDDLTHGVFSDSIFTAVEGFVFNKGKSHCALAGVVGHGIGYKAYLAGRSSLFHNGGFADAGWANQQKRPLTQGRDGITTPVVFGCISHDRMYYF